MKVVADGEKDAAGAGVKVGEKEVPFKLGQDFLNG